MKKTKNYRIIVFILVAIFASLTVGVKTAYASPCEGRTLAQCTATLDDYGDECEVRADNSSSGPTCKAKNCYSYNGPIYSKYNCPTDRCSTDMRQGFCLPKKDILSCEDFGRFTDTGGIDGLCNTDEYGNPCTKTGDEFSLCITPEDIFHSNGNKLCTDYSVDECETYPGDDPKAFNNAVRKDDLGNVCGLNAAKTKCIIKENQIDKNRNHSDIVNYGGTDSGVFDNIKKTCSFYSIEECPVAPETDDYGNECTLSVEGQPVCTIKNITKVEDKFQCSDVKFLTWSWTGLRIITPFLVILFGSLDWFKAVISSDEKMMKQSKGKFIKRLIVFLLLIFVPFVVQFIFQAAGTYGSENMCLVKCIVTNDTSSKGCK